VTHREALDVRLGDRVWLAPELPVPRGPAFAMAPLNKDEWFEIEVRASIYGRVTWAGWVHYGTCERAEWERG